MEPYLVMAQRHMLFEEAVMRFAGVTEIPSFDAPVTNGKQGSKPKGLGTACGGAKIEACHTWLQERAPKRTVNGKELKMVMSHEHLADTLCRVCKKG